MPEITIHHPAINTASMKNLELDERQAVAIYKLLMSLGATKDVRLFYDDVIGTYVMRKFAYDTDDNGNPIYGDQRYELMDYIMLLIRYYRIKSKKIAALQGAVARVEQDMKRVREALSV